MLAEAERVEVEGSSALQRAISRDRELTSTSICNMFLPTYSSFIPVWLKISQALLGPAQPAVTSTPSAYPRHTLIQLADGHWIPRCDLASLRDHSSTSLWSSLCCVVLSSPSRTAMRLLAPSRSSPTTQPKHPTDVAPLTSNSPAFGLGSANYQRESVVPLAQALANGWRHIDGRHLDFGPCFAVDAQLIRYCPKL